MWLPKPPKPRGLVGLIESRGALRTLGDAWEINLGPLGVPGDFRGAMGNELNPLGTPGGPWALGTLEDLGKLM